MTTTNDHDIQGLQDTHQKRVKEVRDSHLPTTSKYATTNEVREEAIAFLENALYRKDAVQLVDKWLDSARKEGYQAGLGAMKESINKRLGKDLDNPEQEVIIDAVNNSFNEFRFIICQTYSELSKGEKYD